MLTPFAALEGYVLLGCAVRSRTILGVWGQRPEEDDPLEPQPTALFFFYPDEAPEERWAHRGPVAAQAVHLCPVFTPKEQWIAVFSDGDVWAIGGGDDGPERAIEGSVYVRALRSIRGAAHAVGQRAIWRRDASDRWSRLDDGLDGAADLRDVAGFDEDGSLYACGGSALWRHDGQRWSRREVPATTRLERVHCGADGRIYLVDRGTELLVGDPETGWARATMADEQRIMATAWYGGRLLLAGKGGLHEVQDTRIVASSVPPPPLDSCASLDSRDGVLLAASRREAAFYDGARWERIV